MQLNLLKRLDRIGLNTVWGKLEKAGTCGDSQATAPAGGGGITARRWWQARNSQNKLFKRWRKAGSTRTCVSRQERSAYGQKFRDSPWYCVCGATWKPSCKTGSRLKSDHTHAGLLPFLLVIGPEPGLISAPQTSFQPCVLGEFTDSHDLPQTSEWESDFYKHPGDSVIKEVWKTLEEIIHRLGDTPAGRVKKP